VTTVSVVVPVFNGLPHLKQAVDWIRTVTVPRVRAIHVPPGTGAAGHWTAESSASEGAYVKLLCQDEVTHPTAIADSPT
jgi:hypothetical protein